MLAVALFRFESLEVGHTHFAQFAKTFPQSPHLCFVVPRRGVSRIDTALPRKTLQDHMPSNFGERAVIDNQMFFADSHRQRLADQPPGDRVTIACVPDRAVGIDNAVDDLCGIERQRRQR